MRFSQRIGKRPIKTVLQIESIDDDLMNRLWNILVEDYFAQLSEYASYEAETEKGHICRMIWKEFYKKRINDIPHFRNSGNVHVKEFMDEVRQWFYNAEWFEVYDFIEFLTPVVRANIKLEFVRKCNEAFKKEVGGYRIINEKIVQVTSEEEMIEIEEAVLMTSEWKAVNTHLRTALDMLADRKGPDYRNSIKESISAVEAFCKIITSDSSATLGKALIEIEKTHQLHGALKTAFSALYGYSSDAGGIRHALVDNSTSLEFEDAKFMLVSCSAFINYLKAKIIT